MQTLCDYINLYLRLQCKSCDLTMLQSSYGLGNWTVGFSAWNNPQNNVEAKNSGGGSRWGGTAEVICEVTDEIALPEVIASTIRA
jgi:hypothetical protein